MASLFHHLVKSGNATCFLSQMNGQDRLAGNTGFADHIYRIRGHGQNIGQSQHARIGVIALAIPNLMGGGAKLVRKAT